MNWFNKFFMAVVGCAALVLPVHAQQNSFPNRPITLIVPYSVGGAADVVARMMAEKAGELLGQPIVVANRPGAGGALAAGVVAKSVPDGYTLLLTSVAICAINPHMSQLTYSPLDDLAPVALLATTYTTLVVNASSPFNSVQELIDYARKNPGKLNFGSSGKGSITHLTGELFAMAAGIKLSHVPYRGNPQVITDLVGGQIQLAFDGAWLTNVKSGMVKALAYTGNKRFPAMPDVPTMAEAGLTQYKGFEPWTGIAAPAGTPAPVLAKLTQAMLQASNDPKIIARLEASGAEPRHIAPKEMAEISRRDYNLLGDVIKRVGIDQ